MKLLKIIFLPGNSVLKSVRIRLDRSRAERKNPGCPSKGKEVLGSLDNGVWGKVQNLSTDSITFLRQS